MCGLRGRWGRVVAALVAVAAAGAVALVGYRVFAPAETVTPARGAYPPRRAATPGVAAELPKAPLIVDGRLRVYAAERHVWADAPIGARTETTPYWSFRRWPQQVVGVLAVDAVVVSKWSDGELVAIDVHSGRPRWRAAGEAGDGRYSGRRTGARAVYAPVGLSVGRSGGQAVVITGGASHRRAFDAMSGAPLWTDRVRSDCRARAFTGPGFLAELDACVDPPVLRRRDLRTGAPIGDWRPPGVTGAWEIEPVSCAAGPASACAGARTSPATGGWLFADGGEVEPAPGLAADGTWLLGDLAVGGVSRDVLARDAHTSTPLWTWAPGNVADASPARVVAVEPGAIYLLTQRHTMVVLDPENGLELTRLSLDRVGVPVEPWTPGYIHVRDRFVVVERLRDPPDPEAGDDAYYLSLRPVVVAGT